MEEASLDDFFAKKDKSKKKSKVKSGDADEVTKSSTKKEKKNKDKNKMNPSNSSTNKSQDKKLPDDDEWNDFEEEKAVDYSGLRVQNLQKKEDQEKDLEGEEEEFDENGEVKERKDGVSGPWRKSGSTPAPAATPVAAAVEEKKPTPAPSSTGKYIPPSQRAAAAAALSNPSGMPSSRRKKELPSLQSEFDFPTLAGGPKQQQQNIQTGQRKGVNLSLENKFSVLQGQD